MRGFGVWEGGVRGEVKTGCKKVRGVEAYQKVEAYEGGRCVQGGGVMGVEAHQVTVKAEVTLNYYIQDMHEGKAITLAASLS